MSSCEPLLEPEPAGPGVWLGGELSTPPDAAEIHWLPRCAALPCPYQTRMGGRPQGRGASDAIAQVAERRLTSSACSQQALTP
jgi:hypothetical protein